MQRRGHTRPAIGGWLDPLVDKLFVAIAIAAIYAHTRAAGVLVLVATRELVLAPLFAIYMLRGHRTRPLHADPIGKATTIAQFVALAAILAGRRGRSASRCSPPCSASRRSCITSSALPSLRLAREPRDVVRDEPLACIGRGGARRAVRERDPGDVAQVVAPCRQVAEHVRLGILIRHRLGRARRCRREAAVERDRDVREREVRDRIRDRVEDWPVISEP
jgi:hypothetical protein